MTTTLKVFVSTETNVWTLDENKNLMIEDFFDYIEKTFAYFEVKDFQWLKNGIDLDIRVDVPQSYQVPSYYESPIKYVVVDTGLEGTGVIGYYVRNVEWLSTHAVRLYLHLDTLNTFPYNSNKGYILSNKTHVHRKHKDRLAYINRPVTDITQFNVTLNVIDTSSLDFSSLLDEVNDGEFTLDKRPSELGFPMETFKVQNASLKVVGIRSSNYKITNYYNFWNYISNASKNVSSYDWGLPQGNGLHFDDIVCNGHSYGSGVYYYVRRSADTSSTLEIDLDDLENTLTNFMTATSIDIRVNAGEDYHHFTFVLGTGSGEVYITAYPETSIKWVSSSIEVSSCTIKFTFDNTEENENIIKYLDEGSPFIVYCGTTDYYTIDTTYFYSTDYTFGEVSGYQTSLMQIVDEYPEDINPQLYAKEETIIEDKIEANRGNWYLLIMNQNDEGSTTTNPVNMYLLRDKEMYCKGGSRTDTINYNLLSSTTGNLPSTLYGFNFEGTGIINFRTMLDSTNGIIVSYTITDLADTGSIESIEARIDSYVTPATSSTGVGQFNMTIRLHLHEGGTQECALTNVQEVTFGTTAGEITCTYGSHTSGSYPSSYTYQWTAIDDTYLVPAIDEIDRTDSRIIKIIELPYCPIDNTNSNESVYTFEGSEYAQVVYGSLTYDLPEVSKCNFVHKINTNLQNPLYDKILPNYLVQNTQFSLFGSDESYQLESKLHNSEFYYKKLVYDSFNFIYPLEKLNLTSSDSDTFSFNFVTTKTINSRFLFDLPLDWKIREQDYPNIIVVSRNNELPIFNNDYITYLKSGYNYDVKNKNLQNQLSWINLSKNAFNVGAVTNPFSYVGGIVSPINEMEERENDINKTLVTKQYQTNSVYGSDDVDLMEYYSEDKLKIVTYECIDEIKTLLLNLFHFRGYACDCYEIPELDSRYWFNYCEADIEFDSSCNLSKSIRDDIAERWKNGVTLLHNHEGEVNIARDRENIEVNILNTGEE